MGGANGWQVNQYVFLKKIISGNDEFYEKNKSGHCNRELNVSFKLESQESSQYYAKRPLSTEGEDGSKESPPCPTG